MLAVRLPRAVITLYRQHQCGWRVQHYPNRRPGNSHKIVFGGNSREWPGSDPVRLQQWHHRAWRWRRRDVQSGAAIVGTAISETNDTTFTVNANGVYRMNYTLRTALLSLLGSGRVQVNGVGVGSTAGLVLAGVPLTDQVTVAAGELSSRRKVRGTSPKSLGSTRRH